MNWIRAHRIREIQMVLTEIPMETIAIHTDMEMIRMTIPMEVRSCRGKDSLLNLY